MYSYKPSKLKKNPFRPLNFNSSKLTNFKLIHKVVTTRPNALAATENNLLYIYIFLYQRLIRIYFTVFSFVLYQNDFEFSILMLWNTITYGDNKGNADIPNLWALCIGFNCIMK